MHWCHEESLLAWSIIQFLMLYWVFFKVRALDYFRGKKSEAQAPKLPHVTTCDHKCEEHKAPKTQEHDE